MTGNPKVSFDETEEKLLKRSALCRISTIDRHGYPHCVRLDYLYHKGRIYVGTRTPRMWLKNISFNSKVAFELDVYERTESGVFDWRGLMIKGEGHRIDNEEQRKKLVKLIQRRHPDAPFSEETAVVCIAPRKKYRWGPWQKIDREGSSP